jgi:hypothetical protein
MQKKGNFFHLVILEGSLNFIWKKGPEKRGFCAKVEIALFKTFARPIGNKILGYK